MNTKAKLTVLAMIAAGLSIATTTNVLVPAFAAPQNGFGQASKDFATSCPPGSVGQHSSSFAGGSREGIGNVAKDLTGGSVSDLGNTLDSLRGSNCSP
jgi:hypothetical protein